jgi:hypothetical protein
MSPPGAEDELSRHDGLPGASVISALVRFWRSDKGLSIFSALLLLLVFVLPPFLPPASTRSLAADAVFALLLLTGVLALSERGLAWRLLMAAALVAVAIFFASWIIPVAEPVIRLAELVPLPSWWWSWARRSARVR